MKRKTPTKPKKSLLSVAAKIGVSRSTLYGWKEAGCPIDRGEAAILEWALAENRRGTENDAMRDAKLSVLRETAQRLKIQNDTKSGATILLGDAKRQAGEACGFLFEELERGRNELSQSLAGLANVEIGSRMNVFIETLRIRARAKFDDVAGKLSDAEIEAEIEKQIQTHVAAECKRRSFAERVSHLWQSFEAWRREDEKNGAASRAAWCAKRAAENLPVPDASDAELVAHPGLKRA